MSKMPSNRCSTPSLPATRSAWAREPLVKISLRPGSRSIAAATPGLGNHRQVEVVHVVEERLGVHLVHLHQARQRRAELAIVGLLQMPRVLEGHAEIAGDELAHALVDLGEQIAVGGIERVVEIEDPHLRALEAAAAARFPLPHFRGGGLG